MSDDEKRDCDHNLRKRSVLGRIAGDDEPIYGAPPASDHEPAWCMICGSLWCQTGFGWVWLACARDRDAPTLGNMLCDEALRALERTPEGFINNCALVNGDEEHECQVCLGDCPDRQRLGGRVK